MIGTGIKRRLVVSFSMAILIPALTIAIVGVLMIRQHVFDQAQSQVTSDLEAAKEIYQNYLVRLRDTVRVHATRVIISGALAANDATGLREEMERVRKAEGLDILTLTDASGRVFHRTRSPAVIGDDQSGDMIVDYVLRNRVPISGTVIVPREELAKESEGLVRQALMEITPTPKAGPASKAQDPSGMMLKGAAPVLAIDGRFVGVLYGGTLLNRNYEIVDKIRQTVFKEGIYRGQPLGTATIFKDGLRISTNVTHPDGSRAITTRVSAEVAAEVLDHGRAWLGRAFVVNDWYFSAYTPIRNVRNGIIGILYVGVLEQPYVDSLWQSLYVFLGIALVGVVLMSGVAMTLAQRISRPIQAMARAAQNVAQGDYSQKVETSSKDEIGNLAESFNLMTLRLEQASSALREWGENLEKKVAERTLELEEVQIHLIQTEKLAALGKLAAGVAHEINNPLTATLTNSSLMLEDLSPDDPRRSDLQTIVDETLRCRKIVKGLLDFARQSEPQKRRLCVNGLVEDVAALVRNQVAFRNIVITTDLSPTLPTTMVDRDQIQQVLLNIFLNAAEAMTQGGDLRITTRAVGAEGEQVEVAVTDTGPGIPPEVRERLFEPFITTKRTGTGLGLAIAYGIVDRHRGTLRVESTTGQGAAVSIVLPTSSGDEGD